MCDYPMTMNAEFTSPLKVLSDDYVLIKLIHAYIRHGNNNGKFYLYGGKQSDS